MSILPYFLSGAVGSAVVFDLIKPEVRQYRDGSISAAEKTCFFKSIS